MLEDPVPLYHAVLYQLTHLETLPKPVQWHLPGRPVAFQADVPGLSSVPTLEEVHSQVIHGREVYVRPEKRRVVEMYLEGVGASAHGLHTL